MSSTTSLQTTPMEASSSTGPSPAPQQQQDPNVPMQQTEQSQQQPQQPHPQPLQDIQSNVMPAMSVEQVVVVDPLPTPPTVRDG